MPRRLGLSPLGRIETVSMNNRRVVITGLGWVTSLGAEVDSVWEALIQGRSGVRLIERFDTSEYGTKFGGEVRDWEGGPHLDKREARRLDRFAQLAMHASIEAVNDAGLDFSKENPWRCGAIIGTGIGGIQEMESGYKRLLEKGPSRVSPFLVPKLMCNAGSGNVSIHYGIRGPNAAVATACASATHAIGEAMDCIRHDSADVMISGGSEAALTELGLACFEALKALSKRNDDPASASRPFEKNRDGFILSEGSGIVILEEYEHARQRGARIYGEMFGYGQTADGTHITAPDETGLGASQAMKVALDNAGISMDRVQYINAHGTSTPLGDAAETRAIKHMFGADLAKRIPVSSTKSMTGHLLGASGGAEAIITAKTVQTGVIPPTINFEEPDEECDLDYVPNEAREADVAVAMSNSFGFGGHNVCLVMGRL